MPRPSIPRFGLPLALAIYNCELLRGREIPPESLLSYTHASFVQRFLEEQKFPPDAILELRRALGRDGAAAVDRRLRLRVRDYDRRLRASLRRAVKDIGGSGEYIAKFGG